MTVSLQPYKGARDFYPQDKRLQKHVFSIMRSVVESFGYEEYDAPIVEPTELFLIKGSQEIIDEQTYTFFDRGGRSVTLRTEMTPTVSRMVAAKRQELAYPLRWYSIPDLWRYERMQRGRLREFFQLNVDLFGVDNIVAEIEMIQVVHAIMQKLGAKPSMYEIKVNSRELVNFLTSQYLQLDEVQSASLMRLIDRMHKMDEASFLAQVDALLTHEQREHGGVERLRAILAIKSLDQLPKVFQSHPSVVRLRQLMQSLHDLKITNTVFDVTLMRGFDYYTDIVFEVFDTHPDNNRSMFGGGRYDGLVGQFGVDPVPTVGFAMGDVPLFNFLEVHELVPELTSETDVYIVLIGDVYIQSARVVAKLRAAGVNVAIDTTGRKIEKQIKTAVKKNIRHALIIGEQEIATERYKIKNLQTGVEEEHSIDRIATIATDHRRPDITDLD